MLPFLIFHTFIRNYLHPSLLCHGSHLNVFLTVLLLMNACRDTINQGITKIFHIANIQTNKNSTSKRILKTDQMHGSVKDLRTIYQKRGKKTWA